MNYVVMPIRVAELRQTMTDGMGALHSEEMRSNLVKNVLVVKEVYETVPQHIVEAHEGGGREAAGASFGFGLHTGMELQRRIAKFEPERLLAADARAVIERLAARNPLNVVVPDFGPVSLDVSVAAIVTAVASDGGGANDGDVWRDPQGSGWKGD